MGNKTLTKTCLGLEFRNTAFFEVVGAGYVEVRKRERRKGEVGNDSVIKICLNYE